MKRSEKIRKEGRLRGHSKRKEGGKVKGSERIRKEGRLRGHSKRIRKEGR